MKKILLVNLPFEKIYEKTSLKGVAPSTPPLSLACLGASLLARKHQVKIFDFNLYEDGNSNFMACLSGFNPEIVGITFVTPLIQMADPVARAVKRFNPAITVIGGGPHASTFPRSALEETALDIAVIGEGDFTLVEIIEDTPWEQIRGIGYKRDGRVITNEKRTPISDLDTLPFPAHHLYETGRYHASSAIARENPVAWIETSRGCVFGCIYCNKSCFGRIFRAKSPARVVQEFIMAREKGFKEIHLTDDGFTTDMDRAKEICDRLQAQKVEMNWSPITGIRVDRVDLELLRKMKAAGCYRVYYGIESGNQEILDRIKKGITLEQARNAVRWAKEAGLEVAAYFMIGLPDETEETMRQTVDFAGSLDLDLAKIGMAIPLPGTELFDELDRERRIKSRDWSMFKFYSPPSALYDHKNLTWNAVELYYRKFYRTIYLNPRFIMKRWKSSRRNKTFLEDMRLAFSIKWV